MARSQGLDQMLDEARHEATAEISAGIARAISEGLDRHGNDPEADCIIGASVVHAIREIDRAVLPGFAMLIARSLMRS